MADDIAPERKPAKIPDGYKDEAEFLAEARERFQQAVDFDRHNRDEALEDLKFLSGEQWDPDAKALRLGRPTLTINTLPVHVSQVVGDIRINKPAIRVRPAEDADKDLAEVREGLIRAIERDSDAPGVYVNAATNQVGCGIGNFRVGLKYATDDGFDRDITLSSIPNAFSVAWDPMATERTGRDAGYCFVDDLVPRKAYEKRYGTTLSSGLEIPLHDTNGWYTQDTVRVTEYWLMKETPVELALLENGVVVPVDQVPKGVTPVKTRKTTKRSACMYLITGQEILDGPFDLPIDRVPIIRVQGWEVNVGDRRVRWGLVRNARDPSRLRNYWRSISAEMLALAPKGKWLLHESQDGEQDAFREAHTTDDTVLTWAGGVKPEYIAPPTLNVAVLQESALNAQDIKDVTGQHDASLGAQSNETSGKAIMARQREGDVATFIYPDNLHAAISEGGRVMNQLIPTVYDTARTIRVVGEDEATKVQRINDPSHPENIDINQGRYDVSVEAGPSYSTKRVEAAESMMQFVQSVPMAGQVSGDLIAKAQDWPMADKIAERLKKAMGAVAQDGDEELTPEQQAEHQQQQQAAQQQQQIQAQQVQLQMAEQHAKVQKLQADAAKTMAEAQAANQNDPQGQSLGYALQQAQVRKANADADAAQANAGIAYFNLQQLVANPRVAIAEASKAEAEAAQAHLKAASDAFDLQQKPMQAAHTAVDLQNKLNPPEAEEAPEPA